MSKLDFTLSAPDAAAVQTEWLRRVEAEYRSSVITQHLTLLLMQLVAPFELTRMGLVIVDDELVHSELSQSVYEAAGGNKRAQLAGGQLGLSHPPRERLLATVLRCTLDSFCLGETVAVRLFSRLRAPCTQPQARAALDRILKDEVRHKEFGWTLLEWLLSTPHAAELRALVQRELPQAFLRLRKSYAYSQLDVPAVANESRAAWGLMPPADYAATLLDTYRRDYVPLFDSLGIDAESAWSAEL